MDVTERTYGTSSTPLLCLGLYSPFPRGEFDSLYLERCHPVPHTAVNSPWSAHPQHPQWSQSTSDPPSPTKPHRRAGKGGEKNTTTAKINKGKAHLISLSASPTLGCGINTGNYLFIATQHSNICFSLSHGHAHIHAACQTPSFAKKPGTVLSAEAGQEGVPACEVVMNALGYLAIWCPDAQECFFLDSWTST